MKSNRSNAGPAKFAIAEALERRRMFAAGPAFVLTNLVSDGSVSAPNTDANLLNPRGMVFDAKSGTFWVANELSGVATVYRPSGQPAPSAMSATVVTLPAPTGANGSFAGAIVRNTSKSAFTVTSGGKSAPATYLFATETGTIDAYSAQVNATTAVIEVDNSLGGAGAVYKGIAVIGSGKSAEMLAANFSSGQIELYNSQFKPITTFTKFRDENVPVGFAPFNVQVIGAKVYVTYARQSSTKVDDVPGAGTGYVTVFNTNGKVIQRLAQQSLNPNVIDPANSPWGVVKAPSAFGKLSGDILVGNFGDGTIDAFNGKGQFVEALSDSSGNPIAIDGLWDLVTGPAAHQNTLYFTSGPNHQNNGLLGTLTLAPAK